MTDAARIVHVDRSTVVRAGLVRILAGHADLTVAADCPTTRRGIDLACELKARILVTEVDVPDETTCFDDLRALRARDAGVAAVLFTRFESDSLFAAAVHAELQGFVTHFVPEETVVTVLKEVASGHRRLIAPEPKPTADHPPSTPVASEAARLLSQRELEIVRLIATGSSVKQVALALERSPKTIEAHKSRIMNKLQLSDRVAITRWAIREGLVEP